MAGTDAFEALETAFEELLLQQKLLSQQCHALRHAAYWQDLRLIRCLQSWQSVAQLEKAEKEEAERAEAKKEAERKEAELKEAERKEAERKEAELKEKEAEMKEAFLRKEAERKEAEMKEAERKEAERKEAERKEAERKEAARKRKEKKLADAEQKEEGGYPQAVMAMYVPELPAQKPEDSAMLGEAKFDVPVPVVAPKETALSSLSQIASGLFDLRRSAGKRPPGSGA
ncbi:unnamed protein product [Effrenium voratum]|nr:unnamed protein product [Effrenium voratum]